MDPETARAISQITAEATRTAATYGAVGALAGATIGGLFALAVAFANLRSQREQAVQSVLVARRERQVTGLIDEAKMVILQAKTLYLHASQGEETQSVMDH